MLRQYFYFGSVIPDYLRDYVYPVLYAKCHQKKVMQCILGSSHDLLRKGAI